MAAPFLLWVVTLLSSQSEHGSFIGQFSGLACKIKTPPRGMHTPQCCKVFKPLKIEGMGSRSGLAYFVLSILSYDKKKKRAYNKGDRIFV